MGPNGCKRPSPCTSVTNSRWNGCHACLGIIFETGAVCLVYFSPNLVLGSLLLSRTMTFFWLNLVFNSYNKYRCCQIENYRHTDGITQWNTAPTRYDSIYSADNRRLQHRFGKMIGIASRDLHNFGYIRETKLFHSSSSGNFRYRFSFLQGLLRGE